MLPKNDDTIDREAYRFWRARLPQEYPVLLEDVECEDCGGEGYEVCPHCGQSMEDEDCSTCDGEGSYRIHDLVDEKVYLDVIEWEKDKARGLDAGEHPLVTLIRQHSDWRPGQEDAVPIVLHIEGGGE